MSNVPEFTVENYSDIEYVINYQILLIKKASKEESTDPNRSREMETTAGTQSKHDIQAPKVQKRTIDDILSSGDRCRYYSLNRFHFDRNSSNVDLTCKTKKKPECILPNWNQNDSYTNDKCREEGDIFEVGFHGIDKDETDLTTETTNNSKKLSNVTEKINHHSSSLGSININLDMTKEDVSDCDQNNSHVAMRHKSMRYSSVTLDPSKDIRDTTKIEEQNPVFDQDTTKTTIFTNSTCYESCIEILDDSDSDENDNNCLIETLLQSMKEENSDYVTAPSPKVQSTTTHLMTEKHKMKSIREIPIINNETVEDKKPSLIARERKRNNIGSDSGASEAKFSASPHFMEANDCFVEILDESESTEQFSHCDKEMNESFSQNNIPIDDITSDSDDSDVVFVGSSNKTAIELEDQLKAASRKREEMIFKAKRVHNTKFGVDQYNLTSQKRNIYKKRQQKQTQNQYKPPKKKQDYAYTLEGALLQERLLQASANRVRALEEERRRREIHLRQLKQTNLSDGKIFSAIVHDVTTLPTDHWKWKDPWSRLGLPPNSNIQMVKRNYRKLLLLYHPDKCKDCHESASRFHAVKEAYDKISGMTV